MAKYKAYPEYKDSGVEWLGKIPSGWLLKKAKYIFQRIQRPLRNIDGVVTAFRDGQVTLRTNRRTDGFTNSVKEIGYQGVRRNDLVIHAMDGFAGAIGVSDSDGKCSPVCSVCIPWKNQSVNMRFYGYLVRQLAVTDYILSLAKGIRERSTEFRFTEFSGLMLPIPPVYEQNQIAAFLDHETAKIDNLIEKQQQLIELLKEKRQAVISHAVTKGLNPDVPMKDSGVEWLGEVPEHWGVTRAKFISKIFVPQRNKPELNSDSGIFWVTMENMSQHYITSSHQRVSDLAASQSGSKILPKGAVIASCVGNFGVAAINKVDVIINQQLQAFQPVNVIADYLLAMVSISKNYFELIGTAATLIYVNKEGFENLPVLVPPESEQVSICKFIDDNNEKFELLIDHSINQINLLQERRTALISAAVTGKIDVRDWVAPDTQKTEETAA